jgi:NAD(P)-dependent dehydrogenase (short-subunit alcohol dehydrogenase family)
MVALVSGGSRGIGRLLSTRLARAGAAVGLIARSAPGLVAAVGEISRTGGTAAAACADITDKRAAAAAVSYLRDRLGTADVLINNAGISGPIGPAWDVPPVEWWRTIEVNLCGAFVLTQLALADMVAEGKGRIINVTSHAGVYRWPLMSAYAASKAALVKLTETLAEETRPHGVAVFSVDPGLRDQSGGGRGADPDGAARLILALASGKADRLSGRHVCVGENLEALLARIDEIERDDLHTLRLRTGI